MGNISNLCQIESTKSMRRHILLGDMYQAIKTQQTQEVEECMETKYQNYGGQVEHG